MKQVLIKQGRAIVEEVPAPGTETGSVLVRVAYSCISVGTELSGVRISGLPLWKKALTQPQNVKKVLKLVKLEGVRRTTSVVKARAAGELAVGYSAAGVVLETGPGVEDIRPGDHVACAGAGYAYHAEVICVPRNLVTPIPKNLDLKAASTVTLGAIALQGVRRARPTLGETFVVIGLGNIGQLTAQLLKLNGTRVIALDLDPERVRLAQRLGADVGIDAHDEKSITQIARLTDGIGADGVIITASASSDVIVSTAFQICRKKGRVVLVGDVGLNINRADIYEKELDFLVSTSYGPGRYDRQYEEAGLDYPVAYVRWTENRNMAEYARLLAEHKMAIEPLVSAVYPLDQVASAYSSLETSGNKPLMVLLSYPRDRADGVNERTVPNPTARALETDRIRIALVGTGAFASEVHLPNLQRLTNTYQIRAIASRTGHKAAAAARRFRANYSTTDYRKVLDDPEVDAVLIATRHHLHTPMLLEALEAGKSALVEKPLALTADELTQVRQFYAYKREEPPQPVLMTGFNRRFSPFIQRIRELTADRSNPMILNYRMNAGYVPLDHWIHGDQGGGRNRGEACHIYDLFTFLINGRVVAVTAQSIVPHTGFYSSTDNFTATMRFADGSIASLTYTALGPAEYPKEQLDVFVDGKAITLTDYKALRVHGEENEERLEKRTPDKGHKQELAAFARAIQDGGDWPIPLWQQIQATEIALQVEAEIRPNSV